MNVFETIIRPGKAEQSDRAEVIRAAIFSRGDRRAADGALSASSDLPRITLREKSAGDGDSALGAKERRLESNEASSKDGNCFVDGVRCPLFGLFGVLVLRRSAVSSYRLVRFRQCARQFARSHREQRADDHRDDDDEHVVEIGRNQGGLGQLLGRLQQECESAGVPVNA